MRSPGINGGALRGQPANPGSPGEMAVKTDCVYVLSIVDGEISSNPEKDVLVVWLCYAVQCACCRCAIIDTAQSVCL